MVQPTPLRQPPPTTTTISEEVSGKLAQKLGRKILKVVVQQPSTASIAALGAALCAVIHAEPERDDVLKSLTEAIRETWRRQA